ncbi:MAG: peptide ABC transporter substrate-binding protein [Chloroflexota bacterium]
MADPNPAPEPAWIPGPPAPHQGGDRRGVVIGVILAALMIGVALLAVISASPIDKGPTVDPDRVGARPEQSDLVVAMGGPASWDPVAIGDATSAAVLSQTWEGLTALDADAQVRPALASSWEVLDGGRRIVFHLRDGIAFSDGTPIRGQDVVDSWMRAIDPAAPSPLAWLLGDITGVREYLAGTGARDAIGLHADDGTVTVDFRRPASFFPAVAASPTLAVVPAASRDRAGSPALPDGGLVVSGAYVPVSQDAGSIHLEANPHYWAGAPAIERIAILTDTGGRSPVEVFQSGDADYVTVSTDDATWLAYDRTLGPQLRRSDDLSVRYYGFDTTKAPFDDPRVRRAVAMAVDWDRLVRLEDPDAAVATSIVPAGIGLRGDGDFRPVHDPDAARAELAAAGYPGGQGLPPITMITSGTGTDAGLAADLERELGMTVEVETMPFGDYSERLSTDTPQIFSLDWIADYPHPQDFLGLLLETGSSSNPGKWSDPAFDAMLEAAASSADPAAQEAAYVAAQRIVQDQAPVIPLRYGDTWALSRDGLAGANQNGLGFLRLASLAWEDR